VEKGGRQEGEVPEGGIVSHNLLRSFSELCKKEEHKRHALLSLSVSGKR
jgi:hypothetical protein